MPTSNHSKQILLIIISHVRYIDILTWIWAFQANFYISWCFLCIQVSFGNSSLFWELRDKRKDKRQNHFWPESLWAMLEYWYIERSKTVTKSCLWTSLFCSQVFKTSDVLNSDENIVNIALIAFCLLAVTKLALWPMSSLLSCGVGLWPIVCYSCFLF